MPSKPITDQTDWESSLFRIVDANANRAMEGLRVVEDFLRFAVNDEFLSHTCKQVRHQLNKTLAAFPTELRLACRSTESDVGTATSTEAEYVRNSLHDVAFANLHRVTEALRTLEENAKLKSDASARQFESIRYQVYTLEKSIGHLYRGRGRLDSARLYVLVDLQHGAQKTFRHRLGRLIEAGVDVIQLRDKTASDRELVAAARVLRIMTKDAGALLIINDRPDIAAIVHADGVHLGQDEMSTADARWIVGPDKLIGISTHSIEDARQSVLDGADYIGVGPVFPSKTKTFDHFVGVQLVQQVVDEIGIPAFPIGGITTERLPRLLEVGAKQVVVGSAIWAAADPGAAAKKFIVQLESHREVQN